MSDESDVSRETSDEPRERRPGRVRTEPDEREQDMARQAELDEAAARRRAEDTQRLTAAEFANYQQAHAIIEADPDDDEPEA